RARRELIHLLAGHALGLDHVLGRLAHRDVDVGQAVRRGPVGRAALRPGLAAGPRIAELVVRRAGAAVGPALLEPAHALDAGGDEHVALVAADRVRGHADGLQARRAVAVHGRSRDVAEAGEERDDA